MNTKISEPETKISDAGGLVTIAVLNTKTDRVENKTPGVSGLVKTTDNKAKISDT